MEAAAGSHSSKLKRVDPAFAGKNILPENFCPDIRSRVSVPSAVKPVNASRICIGAWSYGDKPTCNWNDSQLPELKVVWKALYDAGINFLDTAEAYGGGESENIVGELVRGYPRDSYVIQTKWLNTPVKATNFIHPVDAPLRSLKKSLARLGLTYVDIYLIHGPIHPESIAHVAKGMAQCVEHGLARAIGVANYDGKDILQVYDELAMYNIPLAVQQCEFSAVRRYPELLGSITACRDNGVVFQSCSPLAQGWLSGKYTAKNPPPMTHLFSSYDTEDLEPLLETLRRIGQRRGKSVASVALNYNISKGVLPVVGICKVDEAQDAIAALGWRLSGEEMVEIDKVSTEGQSTSRWR